MARKTIGALKTTPTQNRRVMLTSSGFASASKVTALGSSAIPQMGHEPGSSRIISGCIGQTYSVFTTGADGEAGSRAIPHLGQAPGLDSRTSGSIGQT